MNERIRELAEQKVGSILMDLVMPDAGIPERIKWNIGCTTEHLAKFAELLVKECSDLLPDACQSKYGCHASWVIKEHFGVEE